jgi:thiol-disulfide isomerase/thioredoxin
VPDEYGLKAPVRSRIDPSTGRGARLAREPGRTPRNPIRDWSWTGFRLAVAVGFEPTVGLTPHSISSAAPSAARTRHRRRGYRSGRVGLKSVGTQGSGSSAGLKPLYPAPVLRVIYFFLAAVTIGGCGWQGSSTNAPGYDSADGTVRVIPRAERGEAIKLAGRDIGGAALVAPRTSSRATVVNIWWSGCVECREEAPILSDAANDAKFPADFVGINIRESGRPQARRFEERFHITYPSFYDPGGRLLLAMHRTVPYSAIPTTIVLDREGRPGAVILGTIPSVTTLRDVVNGVLDDSLQTGMAGAAR